MSDDQNSDMLSGHAAIGEHLRISARQAKHLAAIGAVPTFKLPGSNIVRARRSTLNAWLEERERAGRTQVRRGADR